MPLDQFFEQVEKQMDGKLPFVAYRKPNTSELKAMLQVDDTLHVISDFTESGFIFAPFDSRDNAFLIPIKHSEVISSPFDHKDFSEDEINLQETLSNSINSIQQADKQSHIKCVEKGIEAIKKDYFSKVVLSRREVIEKVEANPIAIFKRLLQRYPTAFVYIWCHPKVGLWLGATPETLLSVRGNQLKTMSLAGTQAFEGSEDVVWKEKEKKEQQIVTDFIVESL
ncbi:MAG: chorismate-binding protein, partial [Gelidibacter sp.]